MPSGLQRQLHRLPTYVHPELALSKIISDSTQSSEEDRCMEILASEDTVKEESNKIDDLHSSATNVVSDVSPSPPIQGAEEQWSTRTSDLTFDH